MKKQQKTKEILEILASILCNGSCITSCVAKQNMVTEAENNAYPLTLLETYNILEKQKPSNCQWPMMNPTLILGPNKPRAKDFPWLVWMLKLEVKFADNLWDHFTHFQQTDILPYACAGTSTEL